ncbi:hypothetical protein CHGG_02920 [Chaetomium globosum CBS 148.51]|uniref:Uncharacterized protein n=1 Tax=Chaetomium globosum (strain ATCC 6205 / CBS 148.51 / DSM 1962 / NBRC 6347 / NRRL 1970) TaxID=306901 RepID=Q2HA34_CHAGB|nr:uncharacterized protein CHGG_02920 [Chaetomium globosum CBS 148.51]EAQ90985.1 hypothetical protein CHGG_02920 [Chaetomium globosum CBS 148.51]
MERKRVVHTLDTPYSAVECFYASVHRKSFIPPSKGKRKRAKKAGSLENPEGTSRISDLPPTPELSAYVDVGLSQISRELQAMSSQDKRNLTSETAPSGLGGEEHKIDARPYAVVFVARSGQPSTFHSHFPQMVALAAQSQPADKAVRLVGFSKACEDRLSAALGIPRVSSIGLREDAPQAKGLVDFVRHHVARIEVAWLQEARAGKFLETKIDAVPTKIGVKKLRLS